VRDETIRRPRRSSPAERRNEALRCFRSATPSQQSQCDTGRVRSALLPDPPERIGARQSLPQRQTSAVRTDQPQGTPHSLPVSIVCPPANPPRPTDTRPTEAERCGDDSHPAPSPSSTVSLIRRAASTPRGRQTHTSLLIGGPLAGRPRCQSLHDLLSGPVTKRPGAVAQDGHAFVLGRGGLRGIRDRLGVLGSLSMSISPRAMLRGFRADGLGVLAGRLGGGGPCHGAQEPEDRGSAQRGRGSGPASAGM